MNLLKTFSIILVVTAIAIALGARVLDQVDDTFSDTSSVQYLTIQNGTQALKDLSIWLPIVAIVVAAIVIIGLLGFMGKATGRG